MPSTYLEPSDYAAYGVPNATPQQVGLASASIDGYLQRPEGLIFANDANGNPCYMVNKSPTITLVATTAITVGKNVLVTVTGGVGAIQSGFVCIVDRLNTNAVEACIVISINGNVIQLSNVQFLHEIGCTLEFSMTIYEERQMPSGRPLVTLSRFPVQIVLSGQGRYGYGRRADSYMSAVNEYNMLAAVFQFGGPPLWEIFDQTKVGIDPETATIWAPAGILLAYYTQIRFSYIAGYTYASLPSQIKQACATMISSSVNFPINGAMKGYRAGDTAIERFAASNFDDDTKSILDPYKARLFV